jgi:hypothetical protein
MKKFGRLVLFVFLAFLMVFVSRPLLAQGSNLTQIKSEAVELSVEALYMPCENPEDALCVPFPEGVEHPFSAHDHEMGLLMDGFPANVDVYIVGCINTLSGSKCTTGDSKLDAELNGMPGGDSMSADPSHQFRAAENPVKSDANGAINVIVRSYTAETVTHFFNGYYTQEQDLSAQTTGKNISIPPEEALHLQDFSIAAPTPAKLPTTRSIRIRTVENDPKGRLFDAKSLEPIAGIEASLLDNFKRLYQETNFVNPLTVQPNGEFNFWVPNGIYYLSFAKLPASHSWPVEMAQVHPNYNLAYYCDPEVKDESNSQTVPLYYQQFSIIEYNKLVHCDVPVDPGTNPPLRSEVKAITYGLSRSTTDNFFNYSGKQTHPFTKVELIGQTSGRVIAEVEADKLGFWAMSVAPASYPLDKTGLPENIQVRYTKKDLTAETEFKSVNGAVFEPLLRYLEGYAYDTQGKAIANARVGIKQKNADTVVYLTTANDKGFFKIGSQYLPTFPFDLIFTNPEVGSSLKVTTSDFVVANTAYLTDKSLNLVTTEKRDVPLTVTATTSFGSLGLGKDSKSVPVSSVTPEAPGASSSNPLIGLFLGFLVIAIIGGLLMVKLSHKKASEPPGNAY